MDLSKFLLTTDANNQKQFVDTEVTIVTSTSGVVDYPISHTVGSVPDVRVWVKGTLIDAWKQLTDLNLSDNATTFEIVRGQVSATATDVTVSLRPTGASSINVPTIIRIYYND